jgi:hypothetical protein
MAMSRPKGSKNKPKVPVEGVVPVKEAPVDISAVETSVAEIPLTEIKKKGRKGYVPEDPTWVLTETVYKTPIAITDVCKNKGDCYFVVVPNYRERNSKTTIHSASVIRPVFNTPEIEKEFEGIVFATETIKQPAVLETAPANDTLNDDANVETKRGTLNGMETNTDSTER